MRPPAASAGQLFRYGQAAPVVERRGVFSVVAIWLPIRPYQCQADGVVIINAFDSIPQSIVSVETIARARCLADSHT